MEIHGKFWIVFGDFQGLSESFGEFEIFGDGWMSHRSLSRNIKQFLRVSENNRSRHELLAIE